MTGFPHLRLLAAGLSMQTMAFHLTVIGVAGALVWLAVSQITRLRSTWARQAQSPAALFAELCQAHELSRADRQLLALVAGNVSPAESCRVFLDARLLQQFAHAHPADAEECRSLLVKLFGHVE